MRPVWRQSKIFFLRKIARELAGENKRVSEMAQQVETLAAKPEFDLRFQLVGGEN